MEDSLTKIISFQVHGDSRGSLVSLEENENIPFSIKRVYYLFGTEQDVTRGQHAHKKFTQLAIAVRGTCKMTLDDGRIKEETILNRSDTGLLIEPLIWHEMSDFSDDCVLMVLADEKYDEGDYIRDYSDFKNLLGLG